jgi:large-conductance mechanosensitive channel
VGRLRDLLAHGGIALLAVAFALAVAAVDLARALSEVVVAAIQQHIVDAGSNGSGFGLRLLGTEIEGYYLVQYGIEFLLVAAAPFWTWRVSRSSLQECSECHSQVPRAARICRFCTTDLPVPSEQ